MIPRKRLPNLRLLGACVLHALCWSVAAPRTGAAQTSTAVELGTVRFGQVRALRVQLPLVGGAGAVIGRVVASDACAEVTGADGRALVGRAIPAGGRLAVQVRFDTRRMAPSSVQMVAGSLFTEHVSVYLKGETVHPAGAAVIRGRLVNGVSFEPPLLPFGQVACARGESRIVTATLDRALCRGGRVRLAAPPGTPVRVEPLGAPRPAAGGLVAYRYRVSVPAKTPMGPITGVLKMTGLAARVWRGRELTDELPFAGEVAGSVRVDPPLVAFGQVPAPEGKPPYALDRDSLRRWTRWILLVRTDKPSGRGGVAPSAFWAGVHTASDSAWVAAKVVTAGAPDDPAEPSPPSGTLERLPPGAACWLRVRLLTTAPIGRPLTAAVTVTFPGGERALIPVSAQVE